MSALALPLTLAAGFGGCVLFLCHAYLPEIKEFMSLVSSYLFAQLPLAQVSVDANSYASTRIAHALREEICLQNKVKNYTARDGGGRPRFSLGDGVYTISFCEAKVAVSVSDGQLKIVSISEPALLKSFLSSLYEKYNQPDEVLCFYLSTG